MAVEQSDIGFYRSQNGDSVGGIRSAVEMVDAVKNNLFPDVSTVDRVAGGNMIRKWFLANEHGTDALIKPVVWIGTPPTNCTEQIGFGFDDGDDDMNDGGTLTQFSANARVALQSNGADTRQVTVVGVNSTAVPTIENVTLNGVTEVLSPSTFSKVWAIMLASKDASRAVTVKQGAGGTLRGTIPINRATIWVWVSALSQATGIALPDLPAGGEYGFWDRITWAAGVSAVRPAESVANYTET